MQCSGIILKITTDLHLVLILLCQVRPFATRRLVKEDNCRPVRRIYSAGTIGWHNSALDRRKFYDIKLHGDFVSHHHTLNDNLKWQVMWEYHKLPHAHAFSCQPKCCWSQINLLILCHKVLSAMKFVGHQTPK